MVQESKNTKIHLNLNNNIKAKLEEVAKIENRSLNNLIETLLIKFTNSVDIKKLEGEMNTWNY